MNKQNDNKLKDKTKEEFICKWHMNVFCYVLGEMTGILKMFTTNLFVNVF